MNTRKMIAKLTHWNWPKCRVIRKVSRALWGVLLSVFSLAASAEMISLTTFHYPPYMDEPLPDHGLACELAREAYKSVGEELSFEFLPLKRSTYRVATGSALGQIGTIWNFDSEFQDNIYPVPMFNFDVVGIYLKDKLPKLKLHSINDLKKYHIGVIRGSSTAKLLIHNGMSQVEEVGTLEQLFNMLMFGRVDMVMIVDLSALSYISEHYPLEQHRFQTTKVVQKMVGHVVFSKKHPKHDIYSQKLKDGLSKIRENGTYKQIVKKYYGTHDMPATVLENRVEDSVTLKNSAKPVGRRTEF